MSSPDSVILSNQIQQLLEVDPMELPEEITESVEELRAKLAAMKRLLEQDLNSKPKKQGNCVPAESIIDGTFLSAVFAVVLLMIVGVSIYAFQNLYFAILKKFPSHHDEL